MLRVSVKRLFGKDMTAPRWTQKQKVLAYWQRKMKILVREAAYELFETAGPSCVTEGVCGEAHPCGEPYLNVEAMLSE